MTAVFWGCLDTSSSVIQLPFLDANIVSGDRLLDWVTKEVQGLCKAQGKDSRGSKGKREEMGVGRGEFEQGEAQTVESYFRPDWN